MRIRHSKQEYQKLIPLIIQDYQNNVSINTIISKYHISWKFLNKIRQENNLTEIIRRVPRGINTALSEEDEKEIMSLYLEKKITIKEIAKKYDVYQSTVSRFIKKRGFEIKSPEQYRRYSIDESFFSFIDTEAKAYFLGLLLSDGNLHSKKKHRFSIGLHSKDEYILQKFLTEIKYEGDLKYLNNNVTKIVIDCKNLYKDLLKLGLTPNKSLTVKFPPLQYFNPDIIHHFIRGIFDGDGCITHSFIKHYPTPNATFSIVSTENVCSTIAKILSEQIGVNIPKLTISPNKINRVLPFSGRKQVLKIFNYLYKDATFYLTRKYNKFIYLKNF